jgi:cytochrome b
VKLVRIWDIPTRLFHWSLVVLIGISFYTGLSGGFVEMDYHMISGYCILSLVLFRILWGLFGGYYARFTTFVKGPGTIIRYLKNLGTNTLNTKTLNTNTLNSNTLNSNTLPYAGHNPLGALSIVSILLVLFTQAMTGMFANDDIMLEGPLVHLVSYDTSRMLTGIHKTNKWIIGALVLIHLLAILFYQFYKKDRLIIPMISGRKLLSEPAAMKDSLLRELMLGGIALAISASTVYVLITYV